MDTEKMLPYQDFDLGGITLLDFTDEALQIIQFYVEVTRHVQEIHQLFELFQYNLRRLLSLYELNNGDRVKRREPCFEGFSDRIELNALTAAGERSKPPFYYSDTCRMLVDNAPVKMYTLID